MGVKMYSTCISVLPLLLLLKAQFYPLTGLEELGFVGPCPVSNVLITDGPYPLPTTQWQAGSVSAYTRSHFPAGP